MKRYQYRLTRLFHIVVWSVILILSFSVLLKCIRIFGMESFTQSTTLESNIVSTACNYMIQSNMPIMDYIANQEENENNNLIINTLAGVFPINRYIVNAEEEVNENLIEEEPNTLLFTRDFNLLSNMIEEQRNTYNSTKNNALTDSANSFTGDGKGLAASTLNGIMPIDIINGEVYLEAEDSTGTNEEADNGSQETLGTINGEHFTLKQLLNRQFLYNNFYIIDSATVVSDELFDAEKLIGKDMTIETNSDKPQILIYHTHSQEAYSDSKEGEEEDTVVGVGSNLEKILTEKYGYNVIHDRTQYDLMGGTLDRNLAYNYACDGIEKILNDNPTIEVVIDLHRDGAKSKRVSNVNGKDTAKLMLFNGLSRNTKGEIAYLDNPYLQDNLAFSLQLQLKGKEVYPGLMYKNYLHAYRYNMHLRKKSLLVEIGTQHNTVSEAMNSMEFLAEILYDVLSGEK